jgi:hypothetical protein
VEGGSAAAACDALIRSVLRAEPAFASSYIGHLVCFVEDEHTFEAITRPVEDLLEATALSPRLDRSVA